VSVGLIYHEVFLEHGVAWHPENRRRLEAVLARLEREGWLERLARPPVLPATLEEAAWVHDPGYLEELELISRQRAAETYLDGDTIATPATWEAALRAAGGCIAAARAVRAGELEAAFCLVRPPGHHANRDRGRGFCFLNNVALAAEALIREGAAKVAIVDWDVHHGNGTQELFYHRGDVLYISIHQAYYEGGGGIFYPGTGTVDELGVDAGYGKNINIPLPGGAVDEDYLDAFAQVVVPALRAYRPQFILVSAGYDAHYLDPIGGMRLTAPVFHALTHMLMEVGRQVCQGGLVLVLEGGYDLEALAEGVDNCLRALHGLPAAYTDQVAPPPRPADHQQVRRYLQHAVERHRERLGI
jgi:acetoin utilization deacetylase AcuC-like enzyme